MFVVRVRDKVDSVRGKGFVRRLSSVSSVSSRSSSRVILDKSIKDGRPWEATGGTGGSPPNVLYFTFIYRNFGGEPPVPPIASILSFSFF